jgi:hypothetical protein
VAAPQNQRPLISLRHPRSAWAGGETVYVCTSLTKLNGKELRLGAANDRKLYIAAKTLGDHDAAQSVVEKCVTDRVIDRLIDAVEPHMMNGTSILCVVPHPHFYDMVSGGADLPRKPRVTNALPLQYAAHLSAVLDASVDMEIVQKARVGRTQLTAFPRFLWQPSFDGAIRPDAAYIIADDVLTHGGTIAALRSHIIRGGGTVAAYTTLAHGSGDWQPLAMSDGTWQQLCSLFGEDLSSFWEREIGHDARYLSEAEGRVLANWGGRQGRTTGAPLLQCLRDRLAQAAAKCE